MEPRILSMCRRIFGSMSQGLFVGRAKLSLESPSHFVWAPILLSGPIQPLQLPCRSGFSSSPKPCVPPTAPTYLSSPSSCFWAAIIGSLLTFRAPFLHHRRYKGIVRLLMTIPLFHRPAVVLAEESKSPAPTPVSETRTRGVRLACRAHQTADLCGEASARCVHCSITSS
jgi:hypothetical protein